MTPFIHALVVHEDDIDQYGHVNNAKYLIYYEQCRRVYATSRGYGPEVVKELQQGPIVLEAHVKFKKELSAGDEVSISYLPEPTSRRFFNVHQEMFNPKGEICSSAKYVMAFFDLKERKIIPFNDHWKRVVGAD